MSKAKQATPAVAPQQATPVAVRGGLVISHISLTANQYRTKAQHNLVWWAAIQAAIKAANGSPVAVQPLVQTQQNPQGIPMAFFGYCVRRGYLNSVTV